MPHFSIITAFRNRDLLRVKNSLDSLAIQSMQDYELIFVDYGSDAELSVLVKPLVESYPFARYIYAETRGMFWNRAHSLNIGIRLSKGNIFILWDIDLMVENDFLTKLSNIDFGQVFTTHRCYYLPESAATNNFKTKAILKKAVHAYVGLCCVQADILKQINGFDEFYQIWGAEDDDLYNRLQRAGIQRKQIDATELAVYHQWHPTQAPALPDMWYLQMVEHLYAAKDSASQNFGHIFTSNNRPALNAYQTGTYKQLVQIELETANKTLLYNQLIKAFKHNTDAKGFYIDYKYPQLEFSSKAQYLIARFNQFMESQNLNFRLINHKQQEREELKENIYSFLKYFIGTNRHKMNDYYLNWRTNGFLLVINKK